MKRARVLYRMQQCAVLGENYKDLIWFLQIMYSIGPTVIVVYGQILNKLNGHPTRHRMAEILTLKFQVDVGNPNNYITLKNIRAEYG